MSTNLPTEQTDETDKEFEEREMAISRELAEKRNSLRRIRRMIEERFGQ